MWDFAALRVCEEASQLNAAIYRVTAAFNADDGREMAGQLRRASVGISANIVEGCSRIAAPEAACYLRAALGCADALEYHLLLGRDLELLNATDYRDLTGAVDQIRRLLAAQLRDLRGTA